MVKVDVIKIKFAKPSVEVSQDSSREPDIPDIVIPSPETTVPSPSNTESSNASPVSESTDTESTNSEPASNDPVPDAAKVNPIPSPEKSYLIRTRAPVVRYESTLT